MKRLFAFTLCALGIAYAIIACGGGGDATTTTTATDDKLTIVGAGS